jgi:putative transposase
MALLAPRIGTRAACAAAGVPQASWYRRHRVSAAPPARITVPHRDRRQPRALTPAERRAILAMLHSDRFADLAPAEAWAILLDEGTYLGSAGHDDLGGCHEMRSRGLASSNPSSAA